MGTKSGAKEGVAVPALSPCFWPYPGPYVYFFVSFSFSQVDLLPGPFLFLSLLFYSRLLFLHCLHSRLHDVLLLVSSR
jgi:hypothetical protein